MGYFKKSPWHVMISQSSDEFFHYGYIDSYDNYHVDDIDTYSMGGEL